MSTYDRDDVTVKGVPAKTDGVDLSNPVTYTEDGTRRSLDTSVTNALVVGGAARSMTNKMRFVTAAPDSSVGAAYSTVYSYSGSGYLHGFVAHFDSNNIFVKLTVDGTEIIFELTLNQISTLQSQGQGGGGGGNSLVDYLVGMLSVGPSGHLNARFEWPIAFGSSILIETKKESGNNKTLTEYMVGLEKIT